MNIKNKFFLYLFACLAVCAAIIGFIIIPTVNDIRKISSMVTDERADLEKKYKKGQLLQKTINDFNKIKPFEERINSIFVKKDHELDFILELEKIAAENKVNQKLINRSDQTANDTLPLEVQVEGYFPDTLKYLRQVEKLSYYFNVEEVKFSSAGQKYDGQIKMFLSGKIFIDAN
ncbi:hypothetical protein C4569_03310 [Candidatus Parcubacteria bacterium]|nr:MAG: hypothetical protein C4569_03310 [Candidatus Parcubacteria bacterium]